MCYIKRKQKSMRKSNVKHDLLNKHAAHVTTLHTSPPTQHARLISLPYSLSPTHMRWQLIPSVHNEEKRCGRVASLWRTPPPLPLPPLVSFLQWIREHSTSPLLHLLPTSFSQQDLETSSAHFFVRHHSLRRHPPLAAAAKSGQSARVPKLGRPTSPPLFPTLTHHHHLSIPAFMATEPDPLTSLLSSLPIKNPDLLESFRARYGSGCLRIGISSCCSLANSHTYTYIRA